MLTVSKNKHRALNAAQELLDDHGSRSVTKLAAEHVAKLVDGFIQRIQNQNAFASSQAISLQHVWGFQ